MINESWKDDPIIKFGTSLYSLKPIGLGTWYVESLTSYITRLARAHSLSVSNLVYNVLLRIEQGARKHSSFFVKSKKFLSDSPTTNKLISVLEELNGVDSIEFLTTKKWDFGSQNKQVFDNFKKWCPVCYYNMYKHEKNGCGEIYEPLIWFFKDIEYCPIHEVPLESQCPYCRSKNRHIDKNSRCGFCSKCNAFLGLEEVKINNLDKDKEWHKSAISNISSLIIQLQSDNHRPKHNWNSNIEKIVYTLFGNSVYRFCKQVGLGTSGYRWLHGQSPHLEGLLRVSHICNIPIEKLIMTI